MVSLYAFASLAFITFFIALFKKQRKVLYWIALFSLLLFSFILRDSGFIGDFLVYKDVLKSDIKEMLNSPYYLREIGYWGGSTLFYQVLQDEVLTFLFIDFLFFAFFTCFCYKNKIPAYYVLLFFIIFPSILGIQNVYRQHLATILIVISIFSQMKIPYKLLLMFSASLLHNVTVLFLPFVFILRKKYLYALVTSLGVLYILFFLGGEKSNQETGEFPPILYMVFIFGFFFSFLLLYKLKIRLSELNKIYFYSYAVILLSLSLITMGGGQSKRVGMMLFLILLTDIIFLVEKKSKNIQTLRLLRSALVILGTLSTIILPASYNMLIIR